MKWLSILSLVKEILEARFLNSSSVFAILGSFGRSFHRRMALGKKEFCDVLVLTRGL